MAIRVGTGQTTQVKAVRAAGRTTRVERIVVGRPIGVASSGTVSIDTLVGVDTTFKAQGALLVYEGGVLSATNTLDDPNTIIDGGSF
jgi:hypothetical protein